MPSENSSIEYLRKHRWTAVTILLVALLVVFLLFGAITVIGMVGTGDADADPELPNTRFTFTEVNATVSDHDGPEDRTAVEIAYRSGTDVDLEQIEVRVNDQTAWDVSENEDGRNASVAVWDESSATVSGDSVRVVIYGDALDGGDIETEGVSDRYDYLEEGDVVDIVWYGDDGETMTVLQRYEVE